MGARFIAELIAFLIPCGHRLGWGCARYIMLAVVYAPAVALGVVA
jgi:hypothetical protein